MHAISYAILFSQKSKDEIQIDFGLNGQSNKSRMYSTNKK